MHVILTATAGPAAGSRVVLRQGQTARVGRTAWADFSIPSDAEMADVHFELAFGPQGCQLRSLGPAVTMVNDAAVTEVTLHTDDQILAGQTTFSVQVHGEVVPQPQPPGATEVQEEKPSATMADAESGPRKTLAAADYCRQIEIGEDAQQLLDDDLPPADFLDLLVARELLADAIRFLACWLPKPEAVRWGCDCVLEASGDRLRPDETAAIEAAQQWAAEPNEQHRRAAEAAAEMTELSGSAGWLAFAAFGSGGSLGPPYQVKVPPDEELTAQTVAGALLTTAMEGDPSQTGDTCRRFVEAGRKLLDARDV